MANDQYPKPQIVKKMIGIIDDAIDRLSHLFVENHLNPNTFLYPAARLFILRIQIEINKGGESSE